ncbi:FecR family protein [Ancylobacter pratisalsi]|nr:FecR domain-containing protein [Ancylobacter pratisalsi]
MEALEWFVLLKDEKVSPADRRAFNKWLAADPSHAAAYDRAGVLWERFDIVTPEYERLRRSGRISRRNAMLGGLAVLAAGPAVYLLMRQASSPDYQTGVAERLTFTLSDGSLVELGSYSALSLDFTPQQRRLVLHRGQAFFRVASDATRPFIVQAEMGTAEALGTEFDVKLTPEGVLVSVIEHSVRIEAAQSSPVILQAGWQLRYDAVSVQPPIRVDLSMVQAWRHVSLGT